MRVRVRVGVEIQYLPVKRELFLFFPGGWVYILMSCLSCSLVGTSPSLYVM